jgi:hypothetical protein
VLDQRRFLRLPEQRITAPSTGLRPQQLAEPLPGGGGLRCLAHHHLHDLLQQPGVFARRPFEEPSGSQPLRQPTTRRELHDLPEILLGLPVFHLADGPLHHLPEGKNLLRGLTQGLGVAGPEDLFTGAGQTRVPVILTDLLQASR